MKKLVNYVLALTITVVTVFGTVPQNSVSAAIKDYSSELIPVEDSIIGDIDELYAERNQLAVDFDKNAAKIAEIDKKLEKLGVEEISYNNLMQKLSWNQLSTYSNIGNADINWNVSSTSTVKWTSTRQDVRYNNKEYQLQIIRGVPKNSSSELADSNLAYSTSDSGFKSGAKNVLEVVVSEALGDLPSIGGAISTAKSFYDAFKGAIAGMTSTTNVGSVKCSYTTSLAVEELYVFVKYKGQEDLGHQLPCYVGNSVSYDTVISVPNGVTVNGEYKAKVNSKEYSGTIKAPFYDNYVSKASRNFWDYMEGKAMHEIYKLSYFQQKMIADNKRIKVPTATLNLS